MQAAKRAANLLHTVRMRLQRPGRHEQAVHAVLDRRRLVRKIAAHGIEGDENLADIGAVVAGILFLRLHHSNDGIGSAVQRDRLAKGFTVGKELLFRIAAEKSHVACFSVVLLVVEAAVGHGDAANFGEWRQCTNSLKISAVEQAVHLHVVAELRHDVFAGRRFLGDLDIVFLVPTDQTAGARTSSLHAGASRKNDHHVFAKRFLVILNPLAKTLAGRDHHGNGDDAPSDAEHRQHGSALMGPERCQRVSQ